MKAFISYPSEKIEAARNIYSMLTKVGVDTFLDKETISVGEEWNQSIKDALNEADIVILVCCAKTFSKTTMIAEELALIEEMHLETPRTRTRLFLKPILLDNTVLPKFIAQFQYTKFRDPHFYDKLLNSVMESAEDLGSKKVVVQIEKTLNVKNLEVQNVINAYRRKNINILAIFPRYNKKSRYWDYVNSSIHNVAMGDYYSGIRGSKSWHQELAHESTERGSSLEVGFSEFWRHGEFVSLIYSRYDYSSGAAHANHRVTSKNYFGADCGETELDELFELNEEDGLRILDACTMLLNLHVHEDEVFIDFKQYVEPEYDQSALQILKYYNLNNVGISFNFGSAAGLPHVCGELDVLIPWESFNFRIGEDVKGSKIEKWLSKRLGK